MSLATSFSRKVLNISFVSYRQKYVIGSYDVNGFFKNSHGASMDFTPLAKELTKYLLPFLPFLWEMSKGAAEQATQGAVQKFGADAWDRAKGLWKPLKAKSETRPTLEEAIVDVIEKPIDQDLHGALRSQLRKLFEQDADFAQEIDELLAEAKSSESRNVKNYNTMFNGDVLDSTIVTGDGNFTGDTYNITNSTVDAVGRGAQSHKN